MTPPRRRGRRLPGAVRRQPIEPADAGAARTVADPAGAAPTSTAPATAATPYHPLLRAGQYAWALIGLIAGLALAALALRTLRLLVVPLVLALFPAALLEPVVRVLRRARVPAALAAILVIIGGLGLLYGIGFVLAPQVREEVPRLFTSVQAGLTEVQAFLDEGPFGLDPAVIQERLATFQDEIVESDGLRTGLLGAAGAVAEIVAIAVFTLVVLFFYLKDGARIAGWLRDLFPRQARDDVHEVGLLGWNTVGSYFRGQLVVALVDGVFIGIGLAILGVPLALPLGVLVFFGGLFPIVGAIVTGTVAVLVALADGGVVVALIAFAIVLAVQQLESNVLAPVVLGKATELHPLGVLTALTAGGILLGVLGAFIAVPIAASMARAVGYLRTRHGTA